MLKKLVFTLLILSTATALSGCPFSQIGSADTVDIDSEPAPFSKVSVGYACKASIIYSETPTLRVTINENLREFVRVRHSGNRLSVDMDPLHNYADLKFSAEIGMPEIAEATASGASDITIEDVQPDGDFAVTLSGASTLTATVEAQDVTIVLSGASDILLAGEGDDVSIGGSGASEADLEDFLAHDVDVHMSGASVAYVNLDGDLTGGLSGASSIYYYGEPSSRNVGTSGASQVIAGD